MTDCLFCKIIRGEIPSFKVYEDADHLAFLDIGPVNVGHTLVVPKSHYQDWFAMPEAEAARLFASVHRVAQAAVKAVGAGGFNLGMNTGAAAGPLVMHTHAHIMPRFEGDGLKHWPTREIAPEEMEKTAAAIRREIGPIF